MSKPWRHNVLAAQCLILHSLALCAATVAATSEWETVRPVLEANARALSPLSIEWERKSESPLDETKWNTKVKSWRPQRDILAPERATLSLRGNKFYFLRHFHQARLEDNPNQLTFGSEKQLNDLTEENAFDGESVYSGTGPKTQFQTSRLLIDEPDVMKTRQPDYPYMRPIYFDYAGFKLPALAAEVGDAPRSLPVYSLDHGGALVGIVRERFQDAACIKVTVDHEKRRYNFYLDPAINYAVRGRVETNESGRRIRSVAGAEFRELRPGLWLPARVDVAFLSGIEFGNAEQTFDQPIYFSTYHVLDVSGSPIPEERFSLNYTAPGTFIADGRLPGAYEDGRERIQYVIPADQRMLDEAIENATTGSSFVPARRMAWYAVTAALAILLALGGWILVSRTRRPKGTTP